MVASVGVSVLDGLLTKGVRSGGAAATVAAMCVGMAVFGTANNVGRLFGSTNVSALCVSVLLPAS